MSSKGYTASLQSVSRLNSLFMLKPTSKFLGHVYVESHEYHKVTRGFPEMSVLVCFLI